MPKAILRKNWHMDIKVIASSSKGNCYYVSDGVTGILIECGVPVKTIQIALNFKLSDIKGCIASHNHSDHIKSAKELMERGIDVYASKGTIDACNLSGHRVHAVEPLKEFSVGTFNILPFDVEHDAAEPLGYLVVSTITREKLLFACDLYYTKYTFKGLTHIMIEANYSLDILQQNIESDSGMGARKSRILESHMSIDNLEDMLKANDLSRVQQIYLIHMSSDNGDPEGFKDRIQRLTGAEVYVC